jgi:hypothetical protein
MDDTTYISYLKPVSLYLEPLPHLKAVCSSAVAVEAVIPMASEARRQYEARILQLCNLTLRPANRELW